MWCYMMIVKVLRELDYVRELKDLFRITKDGIFWIWLKIRKVESLYMVQSFIIFNEAINIIHRTFILTHKE